MANFIIVSNIHVPFDWTASGGSEEWHVHLAEQLAARGHDVTSYAPLPEQWQRDCVSVSHNGVVWSDIKRLDQTLPGIWIFQRDPGLAIHWKGDRSQQLLCFAAHDLEYATPLWPNYFDVILAETAAHARYLSLTYRHGNIIVSGAYPQLHKADQVPAVERNPHRILWSSSYDRGLEYLLMIYEKAREFVPDLELAVCYGWNSIDKVIAAGDDNSGVLARWKEKMCAEMVRLGVQDLGRLPSSMAVWTEYAKSGIWCYPTQWPEVSCQTIMEAQAFGAIPIYTPHWALSENGLCDEAGEPYGVRLYGDPYTDRLVRSRFVQEVARMAIDPERQESIRRPMMEAARSKFQFTRTVDCIEALVGSQPSRSIVTNGWMKASNREILERLIREHDIKSVVEIGSFLGESAIWFAQRVDSVICIDPWYEGATEETKNNLVDAINHYSMPRDFYQLFLDNIKRAGVAHKVQSIRGLSSDVHHLVPDADLVYIDGDHSMRGCTEDILNYGPKARKILTGDDYAVREGWGVVEAVSKLIPDHQSDSGFWWLIKTPVAPTEEVLV